MRTQEYLYVRKDFSVLQGADRLLLSCLAMGCDGTVTGAGCVYPEPFVALLKAWQDGDIDKARKLQCAANGLVEAMHCGANMAYFKTALEWRGLRAGAMRKPQLSLTKDEKEEYCKNLDQAEKMLPVGMLKEWSCIE